jgi:hypothetical protein
MRFFRLSASALLSLGAVIAEAAPRVPTPLQVFRQNVLSTLEGRFTRLGDAETPASFAISARLRGDFDQANVDIRLSAAQMARFDTSSRYWIVIRHANVDPNKPKRLVVQTPASLLQTDGASPAVFFADESRRAWLLDDHESAEKSASYKDTLWRMIIRETNPAWLDLYVAELLNAEPLRKTLSLKQAKWLGQLVIDWKWRPSMRSRILNLMSGKEIPSEPSEVHTLSTQVLCQPQAITTDEINQPDELIFAALNHLDRHGQSAPKSSALCLKPLMRSANPSVSEAAAKLLWKFDASAARQTTSELLEDPLLPRETRRTLTFVKEKNMR